MKRKLKESYDLFRIIHVHIPEIIPSILTMHQTFLKVTSLSLSSIGILPSMMSNVRRVPILINGKLVFDFLLMFSPVSIQSEKNYTPMFSMIFVQGKPSLRDHRRRICWSFVCSFHEKESESQRIVIENLSKYLLRKAYITNILIGKHTHSLNLFRETIV